MDDQPKPIVVEAAFDASITRVWQAITLHDQMIQWFFENIPNFTPEVGFETKFNVQTSNRDFMHLWKLTEVVPLKKIVYSWTYEGLPGDGTVIFELFEQGDKTKLLLTNEGLESFPRDIPEFSAESCYGGWNYFIGERLKAFLENDAE